MDKQFVQMVNKMEEEKNVDGLRNSLDWLNKNPHKLDDVDERIKYVKDALNWIIG